jgi:hypothetical protein
MDTQENINYIKELSIELNRTDTTITIKSIGTSKIKTETLLYNLNKFINKSDITYVDYTNGGTNKHKLEPINNMFSDNIVVYYYIDKSFIESNKVLQAFLRKHQGKQTQPEQEEDQEEQEEQEITEKETERQKLLNVCKEFLAENTQKIKSSLHNYLKCKC